jgi:hypothetical protein
VLLWLCVWLLLCRYRVGLPCLTFTPHPALTESLAGKAGIRNAMMTEDLKLNRRSAQLS